MLFCPCINSLKQLLLDTKVLQMLKFAEKSRFLLMGFLPLFVHLTLPTKSEGHRIVFLGIHRQGIDPRPSSIDDVVGRLLFLVGF
jgi:hypothetical protein